MKAILTTAAIEAGGTLFILLICFLMEQIAVIERFSARQRVPGILMNVLGSGLGVGLSWPVAMLWAKLGIAPIVSIPLWTWLAPLGAAGYALQFLALVMIGDFLAYWRHRAEHRWFWPVHVVHHSPTELHAANNIGHPVQIWFTLMFITFPLSLIQVDGPKTPFAVGLVVGILVYYIHSPIDVHFGPFRKVLVDNRYHRIHHSLEPRHFDKNFGICFSIWDRIFGTAYDPQPNEWPDVGVAGVAPPRTMGEFLMLPVTFVQQRVRPRTSPMQVPAHPEPEV